jgi:hypothetical protein
MYLTEKWEPPYLTEKCEALYLTEKCQPLYLTNKCEPLYLTDKCERPNLTDGFSWQTLHTVWASISSGQCQISYLTDFWASLTHWKYAN